MLGKGIKMHQEGQQNMEKYNFYKDMQILDEEVDEAMAEITFLWETWIDKCISNSDQYAALNDDVQKYFVRYMAERGIETNEKAPLTLMYNAFFAGVDLALQKFMTTNNDDKNN